MGHDLPDRTPKPSSEYVLDHHQQGERNRLALMSQLLDPVHRRCLDRLGVGPGMRTLEVGCGNGSVSAWLASRVSPGGHAVAVDLDLSLAESSGPNLEYRQADILAGPVEPAGFDLATARAVLHHIADTAAAVTNIVARPRLPPMLASRGLLKSALCPRQRSTTAVRPGPATGRRQWSNCGRVCWTPARWTAP
jgi:SAM-dependent methyltransferase